MRTNATCFNCGKPYYVCRTCESIYSWKNITCSTECYQEYIKKINNVNKTEEGTPTKIPKPQKTKKNHT